MDFVKLGVSLLTNPKHTKWIAPCLIVFEAVLCGLIIWKVPYTEIDYSTYLHQVAHFLRGERNYRKIVGPSGPLVYPAVHVYIYSALYYLTTGEDRRATTERCIGNTCTYEVGIDVGRAQLIFAGLYLVTLATVIACYRRINAPPWLLAPLVLSKRLHSIFLLRLFNDGWAILAFWLAIHSLQRKRWTAGAILWSLGLGIKMTVLLAAPALAVILIQGTGLADALFLGCLSIVLQLLVAVPFLQHGNALDYISKAFEFGRQFLFKWTVNWRFVGQEMFESRRFAVSLLVLHVSILAIFLEWNWLRLSGKGTFEFIRKWITAPMGEAEKNRISKKVTPIFVMDAMLGSMVIGLLCARSLHYQFYAYLGWATPYLLWRAGSSPIWVLANWAVQEYCWLVFPSTTISSALVVFQLALQVISALIAPPVDHISPPTIKPQPGEATAGTQPVVKDFE